MFEELPRMVSVITQNEIKSAPSQSIADLLRYTGNIDIRQRGKNSIQSDVSIRGGSFDHNLILFNGINLSDPQTGHLSLNLPVESEALSRVEILNGPAARAHGANAFLGAINFITRPAGYNEIEAQISGGSYGYTSTSVTINLKAGNYRQLLHYNFALSDGYIQNTDFRKQGIFYQGQHITEQGIFDIQLGSNSRSFGANGYYTPKYPDQYEKNLMSLFALSYKTKKKIFVHPQVYWRRHRDRFELFREDNAWYRLENGMAVTNNPEMTAFDTIPWYSGHNHHISDVIGAQLNIGTHTAVGTTTLGWHIRTENIISTNIGYDKGIVVPVRSYPGVQYTRGDNRSNFDMHAEQTLQLGPVYIAAGLLFNWNSYLPDEINLFPGIDVRYDLTKNIHLNGSYNYTLGLPTFTDLTYEDPSNEGNNELTPYTQHSIESGFKIIHGSGLTAISAFINSGKDVIDWIWFQDLARYKPVNVDEYTGKGFELSSMQKFNSIKNIPLSFHSIRISYTYLDMNKEFPGEVAKYSNLRQQFSAMLQQQIITGLNLSWNVSYTERQGSYLSYSPVNDLHLENPYEPYWLVDVRLSYSWKWLTVYTEASNLLDTDYIDTGSVKLPGRWLVAGLKIKLQGKD
jgi:iron complex outermembrane receptor protein